MTVYVPLEDGTLPEVEMGKQAQREPLAVLPPVFSKRRMIEAIRFLSSEELRGRGGLALKDSTEPRMSSPGNLERPVLSRPGILKGATFRAGKVGGVPLSAR